MARVLASNRQLIRDFGTCLVFDGSASRVTLPHNAAYNFGTGDFTVSLLAKTTAFGANRTLFYAFSTDTNNGWAIQSSGAAGIVQFNLFSGGGNQAVTTSAQRIDDGKWHHIVAVRSGTTTTLYIDGVATGTPGTGGTANVNNTGSKFIGCNLTPAKFFLGLMDKPRLYGRALSSAEISNLFRGIEPAATNLVGLWEFNEGSGTIATDSSPTANNGTITSATYSSDVFMKPRSLASGRSAM